MAQRDEFGLFVPGYRVAPNSGATFSDLEVRRCPIADANRLASVISAYYRQRQGLGSIDAVFPNPSCAIVEALDVLHSNTEDMLARKQEQMMQEARNG